MKVSFDIDLLKTAINLSTSQIRQLDTYTSLLKQWNQRVNLISRKDVDRIWENHIIPSLIPFSFLIIPEGSWVMDMGSGGGLPSIPWKIVRPDLQMLLVDSIRKKTLFLKHVIDSLKLKNISVVNERVENLSLHFEYQKKFDIITARAVAKVETLLHWGNPFLAENGWYLLWKGEQDIPELTDVSQRLNIQVEIYKTPSGLLSLSPRLDGLRWFKISTPR